MDKKDFAARIAAGAILGALAGILLAPKAGKETREDLQEFVEDAKQKLSKRLKEARDLTKEQYDKLVDVVVDEGPKTLDVAKEDVAQLKYDLKERYDAVRARLRAR